jgi:hypothetical protein
MNIQGGKRETEGKVREETSNFIYLGNTTSEQKGRQ